MLRQYDAHLQGERECQRAIGRRVLAKRGARVGDHCVYAAAPEADKQPVIR